MFTYNQIVERLRNGVCTVTFTKVDGSERVMTCTLQSKYLPEEYRNKAPLLTETTGNAVSVWDINANGWRSFRVDTVKNIA